MKDFLRTTNPTVRLRDLERAYRDAVTLEERARIAVALVPEYINRMDALKAANVLQEDFRVSDPRLRTRLLSLRGLVSAMQGIDSDATAEALDNLDDLDVETAVVIMQHAGVRAYYLADAAMATEWSLRALATSEDAEIWVTATRAAMTMYATSYHLLADYRTAAWWLERVAALAMQAHEPDARRMAIWSQYNLSAVVGDVERHRALRTLMQREPHGHHYAESGLIAYSDALGNAWAGEFTAVRMLVQSTLARSDLLSSDYPALRGLLSLAFVGERKDGMAQREARQAIGLVNACHKNGDVAPWARFRQRAGVIFAAAAMLLVGEHRWARRHLATPRLVGDGPEANLAEALLTGDLDLTSHALTSVRGYAIAIDAAADAVLHRKSEQTAALSPGERTKLAALAEGYTYREIAERDGVSFATVRTQIERAYRKLGAENKTVAIARAKELGLL